MAPSWRSWDRVGSKLEGLGAILARTWRVLAPFCFQLGAILAPSWGFGGHLGSKIDVKLLLVCNLANIAKTLKLFFMFLGGQGLQVEGRGAILAPSWGLGGHIGSKIDIKLLLVCNLANIAKKH